MSELTTEDVRAAIESWVDREHRRLVSEYRLARFEGRTPDDRDWFRPASGDDQEAMEIAKNWEGPGDFAVEALKAIDRGTPRQAAESYREWREAACEVARDAGLDPSQMTSELEELTIRAVLFAFVRLQRRISETGLDSNVNSRPRSSSSRDSHAAASSPHRPAVTLIKAWKLYCDEMKASGARPWLEGAPEHAEWAKSDLFELLGEDRDVASVDRSDLVYYRNTLQTHYPRNRSRVKRYRDRSLLEIASGPAIPSSDRISSGTKQSRLQHVRKFFQFAKAHGLRTDDPSDSVEIKESTKNTGEAWTPREVRTILESGEIHRQLLDDSQHFCPGGLFWLVVVLAYTGARLREIMGLCYSDFDRDSDYPVLWIKPHEARPLKTDQSSRWVPVHQDLITLGFWDWIDWRAKSGAPSPWPQSEKAGEYFGRRFRDGVTKPLGLHEHRAKVLHSFRHSFISSCIGKGIPDNVRHLITGHKGRGTDWAHYIHQMEEDREAFSEYVNRISYDLDLVKLESLWRRNIADES